MVAQHGINMVLTVRQSSAERGLFMRYEKRPMGVIITTVDDTLTELAALLALQKSTFQWALRHASAGDPLPEAWQQCSEPRVMFFFSALVDPLKTASILREIANSKVCYPHARECLMSAERDLGVNRRSSAESFFDSALIHFPGRGTAMPRPQLGQQLSDTLCTEFRREISVSLELVQLASSRSAT